MALLDSVKDALTGHKKESGSPVSASNLNANVDETHNRSNIAAVGENIAQERAERRQAASAALAGSSVSPATSSTSPTVSQAGNNMIGTQSAFPSATMAGNNVQTPSTAGQDFAAGTGAGQTGFREQPNLGHHHHNHHHNNQQNVGADAGIAAGAVGAGMMAGERTRQVEAPVSNMANYGDVPGHSHNPDHTMINPLDPSVKHTAVTLDALEERQVKHLEKEDVTVEHNITRVLEHVQLHKQPILVKEVAPEKVEQLVHEPTNIMHKHAPAPGEASLLAEQISQNKSETVHLPTERTVINSGEVVTENVIHTVHNIIQPVIQKEVVEEVIRHVTIPINETIVEAPVVHQANVHKPMTMEEFTKSGGVLGTGLTHESVIEKLLSKENCVKEVSGPAENLMSQYGLPNTAAGGNGAGAVAADGTAATTGAATTTGRNNML